MNRFLLFYDVAYYPTGGWGDFVSAHKTVGSAKVAADKAQSMWEWAHIVDAKTLTIIARCEKERGRETIWR